MTLQQTVSKILGKEVSLEEAMTFAHKQYGVLCAFNIEQEHKKHIKKGVRVYILSVDDTSINTFDIENWKLYERQHNKLLKDAEEFISLAESKGNVYTLEGFQNALNSEELFLDNSWVYITNNY